MRTGYGMGIPMFFAYLYLGLISRDPQRGWFYVAAAFFLGAWLFNRLFMREQIHKRMLWLEKVVNHDHEDVPDEEVRGLVKMWAQYTVGRGLLLTGSFLCGLMGLMV
ncbi:hypothetical protein K469DRAFT_2851 [Zopfia rhizophila CBS 207.26]|uniref:DUF1772-domain-containing protein n=1 Tax=Zopfia rhizophila CBS 207.26 TaxID=1314779 RepID=A0A6A6EUV4_9PEZI|nr:hypothetical protein K469DRAFT_2851 [Zopfia rhizophila CBS 207.26]